MLIAMRTIFYGLIVLIFVDFDDSRNSPAIQDIWMLLYGNQQEQHLQLDELIELYQTFYDFDKG